MSLREIICGCLRENMESIRREREEKLKRWRDWNRDQDRKVVIFGAATMCEICVRHFESLGITVDVICDNNSSRYGEFVADSGEKIKIVSVKEAMSDDREKLCFAAVGEQHFEEISKQLA